MLMSVIPSLLASTHLWQWSQQIQGLSSSFSLLPRLLLPFLLLLPLESFFLELSESLVLLSLSLSFSFSLSFSLSLSLSFSFSFSRSLSLSLSLSLLRSLSFSFSCSFAFLAHWRPQLLQRNSPLGPFRHLHVGPRPGTVDPQVHA